MAQALAGLDKPQPFSLAAWRASRTLQPQGSPTGFSRPPHGEGSCSQEGHAHQVDAPEWPTVQASQMRPMLPISAPGLAETAASNQRPLATTSSVAASNVSARGNTACESPSRGAPEGAAGAEPQQELHKEQVGAGWKAFKSSSPVAAKASPGSSKGHSGKAAPARLSGTPGDAMEKHGPQASGIRGAGSNRKCTADGSVTVPRYKLPGKENRHAPTYVAVEETTPSVCSISAEDRLPGKAVECGASHKGNEAETCSGLSGQWRSARSPPVASADMAQHPMNHSNVTLHQSRCTAQQAAFCATTANGHANRYTSAGALESCEPTDDQTVAGTEQYKVFKRRCGLWRRKHQKPGGLLDLWNRAAQKVNA